jgi:sugar phosphate isomerase/epimerase
MTQFSRRSFLRSSAVIAGATIPWAGSPASLLGEFASTSQKPLHLEFPTAARDRLAVASWPFRAQIESPTYKYRNKEMKGMDLREFAVQVKEKFGVPGVEPLSVHFPSTDEGYLHSFREAVAQAGVRVVNIPVDNAHSFYDAEPATRKQAVEHAKKWVDIAVILGSPSVRTSIAGTENAKPNADIAAEELRRVVDYAASKNILVNLENDDLISEDAFFVVKVIEKVNSPYLHALPDFCNSMASGNEKFNYDAVTAMFHHAFNICHVKDSEVGEQGKVFRVDLKKTFEILKTSRYKGYCSMEWEGPENPYDGTKKLIAASLEYLR